jgi:DNA topoisomerase VI subunit B
MRRVFSTSRLAEFATPQGLTTRVGRPAKWWSDVAVKELIDNAVDAAETAGSPPVVAVTIADDTIIVADQGPGMDPDVVRRIFDYERQTSSREAYVEPTRGAQGNALQTLLAMPFVLSRKRGELVVESRSVRHDLAFTVDPVTLRPVIEHRCSPSEVSAGTRITLKWPRSLEGDRAGLASLAENFACFNPHLAIAVGGQEFSAFDPQWRKWRPNGPPVAHWYNAMSLKRLMQAYAAEAEEKGEPSPTVGAFLRDFDGLKSTQKAAEIVNRLSLTRVTLADLLRAPDCDASIYGLLEEMQAATKPVKADSLGRLGRDHVTGIAHWCGVSDDAKVEYVKETFEADGLPYVAEVAFAYFGADEDEDGEPLNRALVTGLNFSPAITDPFRDLGDGFEESLDALLAAQRADADDPVFVFVHVTSPRFTFVDKGKTAVALPPRIAGGLAAMVIKATDKWCRQKEAEVRHATAALRRRDRLTRALAAKPMSIKEAAYQVMPEAYAHAAGSVGMANARQVMYAARPRILSLTGKTSFDDQYFTQTLLPDYQREHPVETANWDVVYDDRGHFSEPHTERRIGLGTLAVREYLKGCRAPEIVGATIAPACVSTFGPQGRYRSALFIEKEGFLAILAAARIAERFDAALMSTKGMSVTASRQLIDALAAMGVRVYVLHDFDISGFSIRKTFTESGRRHQFKNPLDYVDIGLRLADVERLSLQREPVPLNRGGDSDRLAKRRASLINRLTINGASEDEIDFLLGEGHIGQRVELNAMTSDEFVAFVEEKLAEHGAAKVVPDASILANAYRALVRSRRAEALLAAEPERLEGEAVNVPPDLIERVRGWVEANPTETWDEALAALADDDDLALIEG